MLVNSGSEANDLAWRIATTATGRRGAIVTDVRLPRGHDRDRGLLAGGVARRASSPSTSRRSRRSALASVERGRGALDEAAGLAATYLDGGFTSDGIRTSTPRSVQAIVRRDARRPAALWIADEVQAGHGRTGEHLWSFEQLRHRAGLRHARQADGQRLPGRRGDHAAASSSSGSTEQTRGLFRRSAATRSRRRRAGRAGRDRGRAAGRACRARGGGAHRCAARSQHRRSARPRPPDGR